ncbi:unnamed protein product, partial [Brenthis ino]
MTYNNTHRFFLRTMANRGVLSMKESVKVLKEFTGPNESVQPSTVSNLVEEINKELRSFGQRITIVKDKNTESREETLIFIMMVADKATKAQKIFTEKDLNYFRKLIEEIIQTESREIDYITALNLRTLLTKKEAEVLLERWSKMHYLKKITTQAKGTRKESTSISIKFTLGLRGIHEFDTYFTDNLNSFVEKCQQCKEIVIMGCNCTTCGKALHKPCLDIHMENQHDNTRSSPTLNSDDTLMEDLQDNSSISTDKEAELLNSDDGLETQEPVSKKRRMIISLSDSDEY